MSACALGFHSRRGEEALATRALASQTNRNRAFPPPRVCVCVLMQQRVVGRVRAPREECTLQECLRAHNGDHGEHSGAPAGAARRHFWHRALESALERERELASFRGCSALRRYYKSHDGFLRPWARTTDTAGGERAKITPIFYYFITRAEPCQCA